MAFMGRMLDTPIELIETTIKGNKERKKQMANRILEAIKGIQDAKIAVLGLAFKNGTDDCRQSPAMDIIGELLLQHANITAYDPKAMGTACQILGNKIAYADDMYMAAREADVLVILTEWPEFGALDLDMLSQLMNHKIILDFRNMLNKEQALAKGFKYQSIGR